MSIPRNLSFLAEGASSTGVLGTANGGTGNTVGAATLVATADASTNANYYVTFVSATNANQALNTASSKLKFNPSTGALSTGSVIYIAP
jgi:hypothetical protein